jgi:hypothetical protein
MIPQIPNRILPLDHHASPPVPGNFRLVASSPSTSQLFTQIVVSLVEFWDKYTVPPSKYALASFPPDIAYPRSLDESKAFNVASILPLVTVPFSFWKKTYSPVVAFAVTEIAVPEPMLIPSPCGPVAQPLLLMKDHQDCWSSREVVLR